MAEEPKYNYSPSSGAVRDKVRLLIPDTPVSGKNPPAVFSDAELDLLLNVWNNDPVLAAAEACAIIGTNAAKSALAWGLNSGINVNMANIPSWYFKRAEMLREQLAGIPVEFIDSVVYRIDSFGRDRSEYVGSDGLGNPDEED